MMARETIEGDARFATLIDRHVGIVRKVATTYCRDAEDRADLAQEIVAQLWQSRSRFDNSRPFPTWMYRVALNVALSHVRGVYRRQRHFVPLDEEHSNVAAIEADHESNDLLAALSSFIAGLDGLNRALLLLYLDELSHRDIAEVLGIGESNVGTKIARLKGRLRDQFARADEG